MAAGDFSQVVQAICEHRQALEPWAWKQLAFVAWGDSNRCGEIGRLLNSCTRYWKKAPGQYIVLFHWDKIIEDGLLPPAHDRDFLLICESVREAGRDDDQLSYSELADVCFGNDEPQALRNIANAVMSHRPYITIGDGVKVRFHWDRIGIEDDEPDGGEDTGKPVARVIGDIITALEHEYRDASKEARRTPQVVTDLERLTGLQIEGWCYKGRLEDREDEDPILLLEGMPVVVRWSKDIFVSAILLVYDVKVREIVLQFRAPQVGTTCKVLPDTARLLKGYKPFVERLQDNVLAMAVLEGTGPLEDAYKGSIMVDKLRPKQEDFVRSALSNDVLFLWGPPGTGKTYTLGALIAELALRGERVLAISISNRAVDELTASLYRRFKGTHNGQQLLAAGKVIRLGFAGPELLEYEELFPHRIESRRLRKEIREVKAEREKCENIEKKASLQQALTKLEDRLSRLVKDSLSSANVVFTTVAQVALVPEFRSWDRSETGLKKLTASFHSIVCDEASMMNLTHLIPACSWGTKRVIIAGDDKQLGPVAVSQSKLALDYLHTSLFELERKRPLADQRMAQLTEQSRMHESICSLVNQPFYKGVLQTLNDGPATVPPLMSSNRMRAGFVYVRESETRMTQRGSRFNMQEAHVVVCLLKRLLTCGEGDNPLKRIGIVTPYRAQVGKIRKLLSAENLDTDAEVEIGTVHAFQGSEADAIIWNLVDSPTFVLPDGTTDERRKGKPGRLFAGVTGERVVNVAISRSKAALYVVGNLALFLEHPPNRRMSGILTRIRDDGHYWDADELLGQDLKESVCQQDENPS